MSEDASRRSLLLRAALLILGLVLFLTTLCVGGVMLGLGQVNSFFAALSEPFGSPPEANLTLPPRASATPTETLPPGGDRLLLRGTYLQPQATGQPVERLNGFFVLHLGEEQLYYWQPSAEASVADMGDLSSPTYIFSRYEREQRGNFNLITGDRMMVAQDGQYYLGDLPPSFHPQEAQPVSPDGRWEAHFNFPESAQLEVRPVEGGPAQVLLDVQSEFQRFAGYGRESWVAWSPDSESLLAYAPNPETCWVQRTWGAGWREELRCGAYDLFLIDRDSGERRQLDLRLDLLAWPVFWLPAEPGAYPGEVYVLEPGGEIPVVAEADLPPTPIPGPPPQLESSGFVQDEDQLAYAFKLRNPDTTLTMQQIEYTIQAYDATDQLLGNDTFSLSRLLPEQVMGMSGLMTLETPGEISRIEVVLPDNTVAASEVDVPQLALEDVQLFASDTFDRVTGLLRNPTTETLERVRISALGFDEQDQLVGGGLGYVMYLPPETPLGVEILLRSKATPARVEVYALPPNPDLPRSRSQAGEPGSEAQGARLLDYGFAQQDRDIGYGLVVENPNPDQGLRSTVLYLTFLDAEGRVVGADQTWIDWLPPGAQRTIGGNAFSALPDGVTAAAMDVTLYGGRPFTQTIDLPTFQVQGTNYEDTGFVQVVRGQLVNPGNQTWEAVAVSALAYDAGGNIIGGGLRRIESVPAGGQTPIEVYVRVAGTPAEVILYPHWPGDLLP